MNIGPISPSTPCNRLIATKAARNPNQTSGKTVLWYLVHLDEILFTDPGAAW
jgi:hypothetical protein